MHFTYGPHLQDLELPQNFCNKSTGMEIFENFMKNRTVSKHIQPCLYKKYQASTQILKQDEKMNATTGLKFTYSTKIIEHLEDSLSYNILNLIAEIGGILGLTVGLSGHAITKIFIDFVNKICFEMTKKNKV